MADLTRLDWSLVQTFLAVSETGSLSEAARRLNISQPTAGRQVKQMEAALDVALFSRQPRGLSLTEAGAALVPHAHAMANALNALSIAAAGRSERLQGSVRITASAFTAYHHLPPILAMLRTDEPDIQVDLVPTDRMENLLFREADIAVRMAPSEQLDIVTKFIGEMRIGLYAARSYVDRRGLPRSLASLFDHDVVGYDRSDLILEGMRRIGMAAERDWFATRTDDQCVYFELIAAGCGIGFAQCTVADRHPDLVRVLPEQPMPTLPMWLAAHEAIRRTPRIRRVWDALEQGLKPCVS